jgi:hypothetical protein
MNPTQRSEHEPGGGAVKTTGDAVPGPPITMAESPREQLARLIGGLLAQQWLQEQGLAAGRGGLRLRTGQDLIPP